MKKISRNALCPCGSGKKYKKCHLQGDMQMRRSGGSRRRPRFILKNQEQIEGIRRAGVITRGMLDLVQERIGPGVTTNEINEWVHKGTLALGAYPAPLNYKGFPKSVCTSINKVICHGIPDETVLKDGDIINVDVTSILDGYYADASRMYFIGEPSELAHRLVEVTRECLDLGIDQVRPGNTVGDIGFVIQSHAEKHGFSIVRDFAGHGTGIEFHEEPQILHYGRAGSGVKLVPNMVFTIEPMLNAGRPGCRILADGWTAITADGSLSAQWEHTILVTEGDPELLTA